MTNKALYAIVTLIPLNEDDEQLEIIAGFVVESPFTGILAIEPAHPDADLGEKTSRFMIPWANIRKIYVDEAEKVAANPKLWKGAL